MSMGIFGIGISGMNAAQAGLVTTGHNIANAATPGFSRQEIVQTSALPQLTGAGFIGQGATVVTIKRQYDDVLTNQLATAQSEGAEVGTYSSYIGQIASLLADPDSGLTPRLQDFFTAVDGVAAHPESTPSRQALLSSASALSSSFQSMDQYFEQMRQSLNSEITSSVGFINSYARQIASLNHSISVSESAGSQLPANDLRDQRDQLVASLNQQVRAAVVVDSNGSYNVFIGNGQALVVGADAYQLVAMASLHDPQRIEVGYDGGSVTTLLPPSNIQGGKLGGLLSFRANSLDGAQNALGRMAIGLAQSFNEQHALGQDLFGALGTNFFSVAGPRTLAGSDNLGSASVSAALVSADALTTSDYRLQYTGTVGLNEQFTLTRQSDGQVSALSFPSATGYPFSLSIDGISITLTSGAVQGDSWAIQPTRLGAQGIDVMLVDPARIAAALPFRTSSALSNQGDGAISAGTVANTGNLPLAGPVTLTFDATLGQLTVAGAVPPAGPFAYASGGAISFNGISFSISGAPANGDQFTLSANANGVADNRNARALASLQSALTMGRDSSLPGSQPSASFQGLYGQLVSEVGNSSRQMTVTEQAQKNVIAQTKMAQQALSGVNLDEEAANLIRYQQAYQASGKVIQIANLLFDTVLQIGR